MTDVYTLVTGAHVITVRELFNAQEVADCRGGGGSPPGSGQPLCRTAVEDTGGEGAVCIRAEAEGPFCISHPVVMLSTCTASSRLVA